MPQLRDDQINWRRVERLDRVITQLLRLAAMAAIIAIGAQVVRHTTQTLTGLAHGSAGPPGWSHPFK